MLKGVLLGFLGVPLASPSSLFILMGVLLLRCFNKKIGGSARFSLLTKGYFGLLKFFTEN